MNCDGLTVPGTSIGKSSWRSDAPLLVFSSGDVSTVTNGVRSTTNKHRLWVGLDYGRWHVRVTRPRKWEFRGKTWSCKSTLRLGRTAAVKSYSRQKAIITRCSRGPFSNDVSRLPRPSAKFSLMNQKGVENRVCCVLLRGETILGLVTCSFVINRFQRERFRLIARIVRLHPLPLREFLSFNNRADLYRVRGAATAFAAFYTRSAASHENSWSLSHLPPR